jgi:hypothetical protein
MRLWRSTRGLTNKPKNTELARRPDSAVSVTSKEGEEGAGDRTELNHGGDVALDVGECIFAKSVETKTSLEDVGVEDTSDETLIDTASGAHETECEDSEP